MKVKFVIPIFVILILFCSCSYSREIESLAFVSSIGIDKNPDGKGLLISVRIIDPAGSSEKDNKGGSSDVTSGFHVIKASGETFYQAIKNIQENSPHVIFLGHCKSIVFGKEFAKNGIAEVIDGIERNMELSGSNSIYISESSAISILKSSIMGVEEKAGFIDSMTEEIRDNIVIAPIMRYKFTLELKSDNKTSYAPIISVKESENQGNNDGSAQDTQTGSSSSKEKTINLQETGIFKDNKLISVLSKKETASFMWIKNKFTEETLLIPFSSGKGKDTLSIEVKNGKTKVQSKITKKGLVVDIKCKGNAYLHEISNGAAKIQGKDSLNQIEQSIEKRLEQDLKDFIYRAQNEIRCDYLGIAHAIHNQLPDYWKENRDQWDEIFQNTTFNVTFDIDLKDIGMIREPSMAIKEE